MRRIAIAVGLVLCLSLLFTPVALAAGISIVSKSGDGVWSDNNWQVQMYPAETKTAVITLYNSSSSSLDVEVAITPTSLDDGNITFGVDDDAFTMVGKSYTDVILSASATGGATPGTYSAEFVLKFELAPSGGGGGGGGGVGALEITELKVINVTLTTAEVTWQTNRGATTKLTYRASPEVIVRDSTYATKHMVELRGLADCTKYQFEITCTDKYGLRDSDGGQFKTLCPEMTPTPEPTPPETTPPVTTPPTIPPATTLPGEPVVEPSAFNWLLIIYAGIILVGLGGLAYLWWWLKGRHKKRKIHSPTVDKK